VQLRAADAAAFPDVEMFRGLQREGVLATPAAAAAKVVARLLRTDFGRDPVSDVRDA
jgi:benzil reductase ((S)-benzoin forming)